MNDSPRSKYVLRWRCFLNFSCCYAVFRTPHFPLRQRPNPAGSDLWDRSTTHRLFNYPGNLETCNVHKLLQPCEVSNYQLVSFFSSNNPKNFLFHSFSPLNSISKDERICRTESGCSNTLHRLLWAIRRYSRKFRLHFPGMSFSKQLCTERHSLTHIYLYESSLDIWINKHKNWTTLIILHELRVFTD